MHSSKKQFSNHRSFSIVYAKLNDAGKPTPTIEIKQNKLEEDTCTNLLKASLDPNQILSIETNDLNIDNGYGDTKTRLWKPLNEHNRTFEKVFLTINIKKDYKIPTHCDLFYFLSFFNIKHLIVNFKTETKHILLCKIITEAISEYVDHRLILLKEYNKDIREKMLNDLDININKPLGCMDFMLIDENKIFELNEESSGPIIRTKPITFKLVKRTIANSNKSSIHPPFTSTASSSSYHKYPKKIVNVSKVTTTTTYYYIKKKIDF